MRKRMKLFRLLFVAVVVLVSLSMMVGDGPTFTPEVRASTFVQVGHANHANSLPEPLIDGSKTPGLIPDDAALRTLLSTIAVSANPNQTEVTELRRKVDRMNLSEPDIGTLTRSSPQ